MSWAGLQAAAEELDYQTRVGGSSVMIEASSVSHGLLLD
jgi:hypothetical protein